MANSKSIKPPRPTLDLTGAPRRAARCMNCGETNEIAAFGLCYRCYRQTQREKEAQKVNRLFDRHAAGLRREQKKLWRGLASVMSGLSDLGVMEPDVLTIRRLLDPYLELIRKSLGGPLPPRIDQFIRDDAAPASDVEQEGIRER
jgi:hypothetical protein